MTRIDQFESVFKSATRTPFRYQPIAIRKVLLVSDLAEREAWHFAAGVKRFLGSLAADEALTWSEAAADRGRSVGDLLAVVEEEKADLICTYRSLYSEAWRWPFGLGDHLDVLTQATSTPVLVMPRPEDTEFYGDDERVTGSVLAITDHLDGDDRLVNYAARFTAEHGTLCLTHIEDEDVFERYIDAIGKIPEIDTDTARQRLAERLLKDPLNYIATCKSELRAAGLQIELRKAVEFGHHLEDVQRLIREHGADLLVLNTKDQDQLAMHGLAYPIAVELRSIPLLLL